MTEPPDCELVRLLRMIHFTAHNSGTSLIEHHAGEALGLLAHARIEDYDTYLALVVPLAEEPPTQTVADAVEEGLRTGRCGKFTVEDRGVYREPS